MKKIAALDIGSNGIRFAVGEVDKENNLTIIHKSRIPLRLGSEAFGQQYFSEYTIQQAVKIFKELKRRIDHEGIQSYRAVATSAYRRSQNGEELGQRVADESELLIEAIDGDKEAALIRLALQSQIELNEKDYLLFDIGGGSTELTLLRKGRCVASMSMQLGTVRLLEVAKKVRSEGLSADEAYQLFISQHHDHLRKFFSENYSELKSLRIVGTGGNFRRMSRLRKKILGKSNVCFVLPDEVAAIREVLEETPLLDRTKKFGLRPDRADVIVPAIYIMEKVMSYVPVKKILTPDIGLVHGVLIDLAGPNIRKIKKEKLKKYFHGSH